SGGRTGRRQEVVGPDRAQAAVGAKTVVEPAADVVARRTPAADHLVVAAAAAHVAGPALGARLLPVDVAFPQPDRLLAAIDSRSNVPHRPLRVAVEAMTRRQ